MGQTFHIKRNDTSPSLTYQLRPSSVDISGASVVFNMRDKAGNIAVSRGAAVIVTASGGAVVRYDWQAGDTATAGEFRAEFEVTYADGSVETFPNADYLTVSIKEDLG